MIRQKTSYLAGVDHFDEDAGFQWKDYLNFPEIFIQDKVLHACFSFILNYRFTRSRYKLYSIQRHSLHHAVHMCPR